ncbi:MAG: amino acid ABC transporter permease [Clostridiales bacterium]|nr:amino acid ABC transporter permease [Clostridiales bacterium]
MLQLLYSTALVLGRGVGYTVVLFLVTIVISIPLGLCATFLSNSKNIILRSLTRGYVFVMRGTPLMLQLFFFYFGLPFLPFIGRYLVMDRFTAGCLAFALNYAAYFCEIFRGGLLSVDKGQYEAAKVLGLSRSQTMLRVILPQMVKVVLPATSNEAITLVKDTALVATIGITDLLHYAKSLVNSTQNVIPYVVAAIFYLVVTFGLTKLFNMLEKKFAF